MLVDHPRAHVVYAEMVTRADVDEVWASARVAEQAGQAHPVFVAVGVAWLSAPRRHEQLLLVHSLVELGLHAIHILR